MIYEAKSPTRVDLAGGTVDCWPLYSFLGGGLTINLSIDIFTTARLEERADSKIHLSLPDLNFDQEFENLETLLEAKSNELGLFKAHFEYWKPKKGFNLKTTSSSPFGGGLGGSSSLTVSLLKVFSQWMDRSLDLLAMTELGHNLEARLLKTPTGTQDYIPAIEPGIKAIHYNLDGVQVEDLPLEMTFVKERMTLVYTGKPHHSGLNNWQVIQACVNGDTKTLSTLNQLNELAAQLYKVLKNKKELDLGPIFREETKLRKQLTPAFTSPEIENLEKLVLKNGADAIKICGAGGGGCVLVWSQPEMQGKIKELCQKNGLKVLLPAGS